MCDDAVDYDTDQLVSGQCFCMKRVGAAGRGKSARLKHGPAGEGGVTLTQTQERPSEGDSLRSEGDRVCTLATGGGS